MVDFLKQTSIVKIESMRSEMRLAFFEWRSLLVESFHYELEKRVIDSQLLGPAHASWCVVEENVKQIATRGFAARVKLTRILMRMTSAALNNNKQALHHAVSDLLELGKKVSQ